MTKGFIILKVGGGMKCLAKTLQMIERILEDIFIWTVDRRKFTMKADLHLLITPGINNNMRSLSTLRHYRV